MCDTELEWEISDMVSLTLRFGVIRKVLMLRIWKIEVDEIKLEQVDLGKFRRCVASHRSCVGKHIVLKSSSNKPFPSHQLFLAPPQFQQ